MGCLGAQCFLIARCSCQKNDIGLKFVLVNFLVGGQRTLAPEMGLLLAGNRINALGSDTEKRALGQTLCFKKCPCLSCFTNARG